MHEAIIDLDRPAPAEFEAGPSRRIAPHWSKSAAALVVLGICLATLTRGALPPREPVQFRSYLSFSQTEGLLLHQGMIVVTEGLGLTAFWPDGTKRWHLPGDVAESKLMAQPVGGLLVLSGDRPHSSGPEPFSFAVDVRTGERVWSGDGWASVVDRYLVVIRNDQSFEVVDVKTLRQTFTMPPQRAVAVDVFTNSVVVLGHDGAVSAYSLAKGGIEYGPVQIDVPPGQEVYLNPSPTHVLVEVMQHESEGTTAWPGPVSRLGIDRRTLAITENIREDAEAFERDCGPVICLQTFTPEGASVEVISRDLRTRWALPMGAWVQWHQEGLLRTTGPQGLALVNPADGSVLADLSGWEQVQAPPPGAQDGPLLLSRLIQGRRQLAEVGQRGAIPIGSIQANADDCQFESPVLVCNTQDGQIGVWTVAHTR